LLSVKAALLAADSAGSGVVRVGHALEDWVSNAFGQPLTAVDIRNNVVLPRICEIETKSSKPVVLQDFQRQAATLGERALLLAPCGSGKTLAAWHWIESRLQQKPASRVLFLYPTRATATEGFRDYVSWAPEEEAALAHGTASYDLEDMFDNPEDSRTGKDFIADDRLYALGLWPKRIFSATVDQFLAFMQNHYGPLCLLPLLADSVVVIDEVHSFDPAMFSALVKYLKHFDGPVMCMTASLIGSRRRTLVEECGLQVFPETFERLDDLQQKAEHPRYSLRLTSQKTAEEVVQQVLSANKKVLWVVNQVRRCQEIAKALSCPALCYHSRFKLVDRRSRHRDVVDAFQNRSGPLLAVTTQVCEMSLDLDAHVLISEEAPVSSLIQRMGRCNRYGKPGDGKLGTAYVYPVENPKPYSSEEIAGGRCFVAAFTGKNLSQADLEVALEQYAPQQKEPERFSSFLDSGCYAMSYPYRESEDFTVPAVLDTDIETWLAARKAGRPADGIVVPVPKRLAKPHPALGRLLRVAPSSHYSPAFGFLDNPA
jgi:CRISPR-associated endonuclease/helicase Cas3